MRLLTYNIHKGIGGLDRRYQLDRIIAVLRHVNADVCFLQEVDHGAKRSRYERQSEKLAEALGVEHYAVGINHQLHGPGEYGNVTISRWPIEVSYNLDLSMPLKKRRGALYARVQAPAGVMHTFNFHLGLAHYERMRQVRKILTTPEVADPTSNPVVIAGDSNDWQGRLCRKLLEPVGFAEAGASLHGRRARTFPAIRPLLPLDRLYFRNLLPAAMMNHKGHRDIRNASDHRPLVIDFNPPGQSSPVSETS